MHFTKPPSAAPGVSVDRDRGIGCVRVFKSMFFRGWLRPSGLAHVRVQMCWGCLGLRTQVRCGTVKREPRTLVLRSDRIPVLGNPRAQMQGRPAPRESRAREPWNGGRAELAPRGAGERASLGVLGTRLPAAAASFCCAQRLNGSSQEARPAVRLARSGPVNGRVSEREKRPRRRRGEPSAREASAPARRPARSSPSWPGSLAASSLPFLPGPASSLDPGLDD